MKGRDGGLKKRFAGKLVPNNAVPHFKKSRWETTAKENSGKMRFLKHWGKLHEALDPCLRGGN